MAALTAVEHTLWRDRIRKEVVNASINRDGFSVRAAVRSQDVPMNFKPGHMNPADVNDGSCPVGSSSSMARDLRAALSAQTASPRQRLLWPETAQHEVGWFQQSPVDGLPSGERGTFSGVSPRGGVGWLENSSINAIKTLPQVRQAPVATSPHGQKARGGASSSKNITDTTLPPPTPRQRQPKCGRASASRSIADTTSVLPVAVAAAHDKPTADASPSRRAHGVLHQAARAACRSSKTHRKREPALPTERACAPPPPTPKSRRPAKLVDAPSGKEPILDEAVARRPLHKDPWSATNEVGAVLRPTPSQEQAVATAADRSNRFMNGPRNPWYRPAASSDVAEFANAYTKSWGVQLFARKAQPVKSGG